MDTPVTKEALLPFVIASIKNNLEELALSESLCPFEGADQERDLQLSLLHKIPKDQTLTPDEAYWLTRCVPTFQPTYDYIKTLFVHPFITEAEIYRRDLAEGDFDTAEDLVLDITAKRHGGRKGES